MSVNILAGGLPWYRQPAVRAAMRSLGLTNAQLFSQARQECEGEAVWAYWRPGVLVSMDSGGKLPKGTANIVVDVSAAIAADFVPTE